MKGGRPHEKTTQKDATEEQAPAPRLLSSHIGVAALKQRAISKIDSPRAAEVIRTPLR